MAYPNWLINIVANHWPFVQLFDFSEGSSFEVVYEQDGANEVVELSYNSEDISLSARIDLDRTSAYPLGSAVHVTITDQLLNIDPTSSDVLLFNVESDTKGVSFKAVPKIPGKDIMATAISVRCFIRAIVWSDRSHIWR